MLPLCSFPIPRGELVDPSRYYLDLGFRGTTDRPVLGELSNFHELRERWEGHGRSPSRDHEQRDPHTEIYLFIFVSVGSGSGSSNYWRTSRVHAIVQYVQCGCPFVMHLS